MNEMQKRHILTLRQQGIGYAEIARRLDIKRATVKTHCRRHGLLTQEEALRYREVQKASRPRNTVVCKNCGTVFFATPWREQCFLTAAVQNIKRLVASFYRTFQAFLSFYPCVCA